MSSFLGGTLVPDIIPINIESNVISTSIADSTASFIKDSNEFNFHLNWHEHRCSDQLCFPNKYQCATSFRSENFQSSVVIMKIRRQFNILGIALLINNIDVGTLVTFFPVKGLVDIKSSVLEARFPKCYIDLEGPSTQLEY